MLVVDTCVLSEFAKPADRQPAVLRTWLRSANLHDIVVPVSVVLEIECGFQKMRSSNPSKASALEAWLDDILISGLRIQPITIQISRLYARMAATPSLKHLWQVPPKHGVQTPAQDLMIAATAITLRATLLTYNLSDFKLIDKFFPLPLLMSPRELAESPAFTVHAG